MIKKELFHYYNNSDTNWISTIQLVSQNLISLNIVTKDYPNEVIKATNELGPYYIVAPDIALIHISIGPSVLKTSLSLNIFNKSIVFPNNKTAKYLLVLTAVDANSHMDLLTQFAELFGNNQFISELTNVKTYDEFMTLVNKFKS